MKAIIIQLLLCAYIRSARKSSHRQIYGQYHNQFQTSQVQDSQIGLYHRGDPSWMLKDYNEKQRLKDSQYFFQPAYFNPLTTLDPKKYLVN